METLIVSSQNLQNSVEDISGNETGRLNDRHYEECVTMRGLAPEWIRLNVRSMDIKEASERLGYPAKSAGIWLEGANGFGQFRPNKPWKSDEDKKAPKYRTAEEEEYDAMLPKHPTNKQYWTDYIALRLLAWQIDGRPCIGITEGLFKAIMACMNDIPCVALAGVEQGLTSGKLDPQGKRYLVETLEMLAREGFGFIIIFDADAATNSNVINAQRKLAYQLIKFKVPVYIATGLWSVDEGKGMDDYIQMNGADKFRREVLAKVVDFSIWERQFKAQDEEKQVFSQRSIARDIAGNYRTKLAWHVKSKSWYWYEFIKKGVWDEIPEEEVLSVIISEIETRTQHFKFDFVSSVYKFLKSDLRINDWQVREGFICLEDCVVDSMTGKEYPHEPGYRFLSALPYKWSDRTTGCEAVKKWLLEICEGKQDWVEVLRAAMKATVCEQGHLLQRYIELIGFGGTGKGTILRLVTSLVGEENVAVTDLRQLENNRFETASFYGKKAILITDSEKYTGDVSNLKKLTGNDNIRHEKKTIQQTKGFKFKGIVWVACNEVIQSSDYTSGLRRRRLSMPFEKSIPSHLWRDLETEFKPYLAGLLAWVIEMPDSEVTSYVRDTHKKVPSLNSFSAEVLIDANPIAAWADQCLVIAPTARTYVGNKNMNTEYFLYPNFCNWADGANCDSVSQTRFSRNLLDLLKSQLGVTEVFKGRDSKGAFISGIALRSPNSTEQRLITNDELVACNDGKVTDTMTGKTLTHVGFDGNNGNSSNQNIQHHQQSSNVVDANNSGATKPVDSNKQNHQEAPNASSDHKNEAITNKADELNQQITDNWQNKLILAQLILKYADTDELRQAVANFTPEQIKYIKDVANESWRLSIDAKADYYGELVYIWECGRTNDIRIGSKLEAGTKVKRAHIRPWLGMDECQSSQTDEAEAELWETQPIEGF